MASHPLYEFGPFRLQAADRVLYRGEQTIPLPPKAADTLLLLIQNAGSVVQKEGLLEQVWRGTCVEEGSLSRTIFILRKALGGSGQAYIATVPKRGYRFVAKVSYAQAPPVSSERRRVMLAVLPFENLSQDAEQEYFADGLTEEMITQLSRLNPEGMGVIARTSAMRYKATKKGIREIGRELGVSHILEGSVRRSAARVRIAAQLIDVDDETHAWAETYERRLGDILRLQSEVAQAIATQVQVKLTPRERRRLADAREVSPAAYEAYLQGRYLWNKRTEEGMRESIAMYEEAIRHLPEYPMAYAGMADSYVMLACRGMAPAKETFQKAKVAARKALLLEPHLGAAQGSLAHVRLHDWDWEGLEEDFQRAIELDPSQTIVYYWYGEFLMSMGRPEEAIAMTRRAYRADPLSPVIAASLAMILYLARDYGAAEALLKHAQEINPDHFLPFLRLGLVRIQQRNYGDGIALLKKAVELAKESTETLTALAVAYAAAHEEKHVRHVMAKLEGANHRRYVLPSNVAKIYAAAGDIEKAFAWLERGYEGGSPDLIELNSEPIFDVLRRDSRMDGLMQRVGLKG